MLKSIVLNNVVSKIILNRMRKIELNYSIPHQLQMRQLQSNLTQSKNTQIGKKYAFHQLKNYAQFKRNVPVFDYESIFPFIQQIINGEKNILWPGRINRFAKSSGTTNGKSKYLPVSTEALKHCHFAAGKDIMAIYHNNFPNNNSFTGKGLILGGTQNNYELSNNNYCGDVSGLMTSNMPLIGRLFYTPKLEIALLENWEEKIRKIVTSTKNEDVTLIGGVPSWMAVLLHRILEEENVNSIKQIWPNLELYIHGGVAFSPYKSLYNKLFDGLDVHFLETYNASEGFFAIQDEKEDNGLLLMLDYGIFYEFEDVQSGKVYALSEVERHKNYALIISTNSGLLRYKIGDTIRFVSLDPYKIKFTGRTKSFINAFGEELIEDNAIEAINKTCVALNLDIVDFTVAPKFFAEKKSGQHCWLIEFRNKPHDLNHFETELDQNLKNINSDYEAKRFKDMVLNKPEIIVAEKDVFYNYLKKQNKLGGQNKIPKLNSDVSLIHEILKVD